MENFFKIMLEIMLGLLAALLIYGVCSKMSESGYEQQEYSNSGVYQSQYDAPYDSDVKEKRGKANRGAAVGRVYAGGMPIYEWEHEGHKYIMVHEFGIVHSASCPCGWIEKLK